MYRCGVCGKCSRPGQQRRTYTITRLVQKTQDVVRMLFGQRIVTRDPIPGEYRQEIEQEVPLCEGCSGKIDAGATLRELQLYQQHIASQPKELEAWPEGVGRDRRSNGLSRSSYRPKPARR